MNPVFYIFLGWMGLMFVIMILAENYTIGGGITKFLVWISGLAGGIAIILLSGGILFPGLFPTLPHADGLAVVGLLIFPLIILGSIRNGKFIFLLIAIFALLSLLSWTPKNGLTALRVLGLSLGLFFYFRAFTEVLRPGSNQYSWDISWAKIAAAYLLVLVGLGIGVYQQGTLIANRFQTNCNKGNVSLVEARFLVKNFPWTKQAKDAKEILALCTPEKLLTPTGLPINSEQFYQRLAKMQKTLFSRIAFQAYRSVCETKMDSLRVLEQLTPLLEKWFADLQEVGKSTPFPEDSSYRNLLLPLEEVVDHPLIERKLPQLITTAAQKIRLDTAVVGSESRYFLLKGNEQYKLQNFDEALRQYQEGLSLCRVFNDIRNNLGLAEWQLGNRLLARLHFSILSKLNPKYYGAELNLACLEYSLGLENTARKILINLTENKKNYAPAYYDLGWFADQANQLNSALTYYLGATANQATFAKAWLALAQVYIQKQDYKRAMKVLADAAKYISNEDTLQLAACRDSLNKVMNSSKKPSPNVFPPIGN